MTIKEVSTKYDISQDTLRYYEKVGIIPPVQRTAGGIRNYSEDDIGWIKMAKCMRKAGLSIDALSKYVHMYEKGDSTISDRLELLKMQKNVLEERKEEIESTLQLLEHKISIYENAEKTGSLQWESK